MKKLIIASAILASTVAVSGGSSVQAAAANPGQVVVGFQGNDTTLDSATVNGAVGDTFLIIDNTLVGPNGFFITNATGQLKKLGQQPQQDVLCQTNNDCIVGGGSSYTFEIVAPGTFTVKANGMNPTTLTIPGAQQAPIYIPFFTASLDPHGGSCTIDGKEIRVIFRISGVAVRFPNADVCRQPGYKLKSWRSAAGVDFLPDDLVVANGTFEAKWTKVIPPAPPGDATVLVNFLCGPCSSVALWWEPSATPGATYEVVVKTGNSSVVNTVSSAPGSSSPFMLKDLVPGQSYTVEIFAVLEGARSETGARFGTDPASSFTLAKSSITITGQRTTLSGKPGICVSGDTTGIAEGTTVIPYFRFPGETTYTQGSARPEVLSDGTFEWCRKTGKKTYVYVTNADGSVTSNRVIIPAA